LNYVNISDKDVQDLYKKIADNIKRLRKEQKITQLDLALTIGHKSVSTIAKIEAGIENKHYNLEHLYKISRVLNIDMCEFLKS